MVMWINEGYDKIFFSIYDLHIDWENDVSEERYHMYMEHFLKLITYLWLHFASSLLLMSLWLAEKCLRQTTCCLSSLIDRFTLQIYHKDQMMNSMSLQWYFHIMQFKSRYQIMHITWLDWNLFPHTSSSHLL